MIINMQNRLSAYKLFFTYTKSFKWVECIRSSVKGRCRKCRRINASDKLGLNDDCMSHRLFWDCEPDPPPTNPPSSWPRHLKPRPRQLILFVWPFVLDSPAALYLFVSARNPVPSLLNQPTSPHLTLLSALLKLSPALPLHLTRPLPRAPLICATRMWSRLGPNRRYCLSSVTDLCCVCHPSVVLCFCFLFLFLWGGRRSYLCVCYSVLEHEQKSQDVSFVSGVRPFKSANSLSCDVFADNFRVFLCV